MSQIQGLRIHITGIVQGVGFRPFVFGLASRYGFLGWVRNTSAGVDIQVDGHKDQLAGFVQALQKDHPPLARLDSLEVDDCPPGGFTGFEIIHSEPIPGAFIPISPDVSICEDCLSEMLDPVDRRYLYPFINCTNCGPRFTIIDDIPYDRPKTSMAPFEMCEFCRTEYQNPLDRRFHAQPVACPECGPHVWLELSGQPSPKWHRQDAVSEAQIRLARGEILAIKGLGGFHLACDATNPEAVSELRRRKLRIDKAFAIMMPDIKAVEQHCLVNREERQLLCAHQRPIVLLDRKPRSPIAAAVAPNQNTLGVMLPYTPLHYLLFTPGESVDCSPLESLVMTSGNLSEEPIAFTNEKAREHLNSLADAFLMNNREIRIRCDDSVYRIVGGPDILEQNRTESISGNLPRTRSHPYPFRRSRGYAPDPLNLPWEVEQPVLAVGPELKNTFCLTRGKYAFLSHHIGDMENYETLESFQEGIIHYQKIFKIEPEILACDLHPDYLSTRYAHNRAESSGMPIYPIQHHHAHIAACMADNSLSGEQPVIGVSFDGTGYGDDDAVWGGEFLVADYQGYYRYAHLDYTPLPGGDSATRNPGRIALAQLWHAGIRWDDNLPPVKELCSDEKTLLHSMLENDINCPRTSSIGRLFDAVSALSGQCFRVNYEGQAAIEFEVVADPEVNEAYNFQIKKPQTNGNEIIPNLERLNSNPLRIDPSVMFAEMVNDIHNQGSIPFISAKFHNGLTNTIAEICSMIRDEYQLSEVALSGGVWQTMTLLRKSIATLERLDFTVYIHRQVPANDGGLALGQAVIAGHLSAKQ